MHTEYVFFGTLVFSCNAVKQFDKGIPEATVDGVESWCPYLTIKDIQEGFATLCNQLAFCILGDVENENMVQTWSTCWSNLLYLNGNCAQKHMKWRILISYPQYFALCDCLFLEPL